MDFISRVIVAAIAQAAKDKDRDWCATTGRDWCAIMGWPVDPLALVAAKERDRRGRHDR